jgi:hypothetical protein
LGVPPTWVLHIGAKVGCFIVLLFVHMGQYKLNVLFVSLSSPSPPPLSWTESETYRSRFKTMLAPTYPDHPWWSAIVDQAGGAIIGTIANGSRGIVVEDIVASKVYTMDITTTSPTPSEMPQRKPNCGKWIAATPYLIHRQDRENCGKTILHTICESNEPGSLEALESYLNNVQRVAPIVDERGQTPLDVALDNNEYAHCKILLDAYIKNNISALVSLKKPL